MNTDDRKKLVGLVVGIVLVFAFVFWRVSGILAPTTAIAPAPIDLTANAAPLVATASNEPVEADPQIDLNDRIIPPAADPFQSVVSNTPKPIVTPSAPVNTVTPKQSEIPPLPLGDTPIQAEQPETLLLSGLVGGPKPLAIVQIGSQSYVVRVGQTFGNGYIVNAITRDSVVLKREKTIIKLFIGQQGDSGIKLQARKQTMSKNVRAKKSNDDVLMAMAGPDESEEFADIEPAVLFAQSDVDPFREVIPKATKAVVKAKSKPAKKVRTRRRTPVEPDELPPADPGQYLPMQGTLPNPAEEQTPAPSISVSGIISGTNAVAIVHIGAKTFVVGKNELFDDGYRVVEFGQYFVKIRHGKDVLRLMVSDDPTPPEN
ncbi:MAG: hypothetical protein GC165_12930 [Armatimonadetes bacterium]|nr:hypothetical protein [Armatimonadota bacterium]